jgi:methionine biosynthesis protein MetW
VRIDKRFAEWSYAEAEHFNIKNINAALRLARPVERIIDLGCGDGRNTLEALDGIAYSELWGLEVHQPSCEQARKRGIRAVHGDLNERLPFGDDFFDVVMANQVFEHLSNTDGFLSEAYRILRRGGLAIVSTENMASWHNIVALLFGWQPFSAVNFSTRAYPVGNPLALHAGANDRAAIVTHDGMTHRRIFAYRGLKEVIAAHGFEIVNIFGSGYHPLPAAIGRFDPRHAHFLTVAARK